MPKVENMLYVYKKETAEIIDQDRISIGEVWDPEIGALFAAAPELYKALQHVRTALIGEDAKAWGTVLWKINRALRKAEGEDAT